MFSVVITEKGGSQRQLDFDKNEVTIGRVQGNDIILPKGNVSKRHSRIVLKDNRFIVVDLKSTNGTYVNGRKITSPLVVKPGDKIYIGDFILTVDESAEEGAAEGAAAEAPAEEPQGTPRPTDQQEQAPSSPPSEAPRRRAQPPPLQQQQPQGSAPPARATAPPPLPHQRGGDQQQKTQTPSAPAQQAASPAQAAEEAPAEHFPLEEEPSEESSPPQPHVSGGAATPQPVDRHRSTSRPPSSVAPARPPAPAAEGGVDDNLRSLMARLAEAFDVHDADPESIHDQQRWQHAQNAIEETIGTLQSEGTIGRDVDREQLAGTALREAVGLGALEPLMMDGQVREIVIEGPNQVMADYGHGFQPVEGGFSSTTSLYTAARRLLAQAGAQLDLGQPVQQVTLPYGPHVAVVLPPVAVRGPVVEVRRVGNTASAEELVSSGLMGQQVLDLLRRAVEARRNIVVVGPVGTGVTTLLGALADLSDPDERIVTAEDVPDLALGHQHVIPLATGNPKTGLSHKQVLEQATRLRSDRLVIDDVRDGETFDALTVLAARRQGCFLGVHASSSTDGLDALRVLARLDHTVSQDALEALLARSVQVVVQVGRTDEGLRVLSVSEVTGKDGTPEARQLFVYDGQFRATGTNASF